MGTGGATAGNGTCEALSFASAPPSGIYQLEDDGTVRFIRPQAHRRTVQRGDRTFWLRIAKAGDWFCEGADLGILVTPGRLMGQGLKRATGPASGSTGCAPTTPRARRTRPPSRRPSSSVAARLATSASLC